MTPVEQAHIVEAYTFELGKVFRTDDQGTRAAGAGQCRRRPLLPGRRRTRTARPIRRPEASDAAPSPALSQGVTKPGPIAGRKIGIIADAGSDLAGIKRLRTAAEKRGATVLVLAPVGGVLKKNRTTLAVDRTNLTARSVEFDAVVIADGTTPTGDIKLTVLLQEAYRHCKPLAAWGAGDAVLTRAGIELDAPGVFVHAAADKEFTNTLVAAVGLHRAWDRAALVMASAAPPANAPR